MPRFKHYNYDQDAMVVINYQEQLQPGDPVVLRDQHYLQGTVLRYRPALHHAGQVRQSPCR